MASSSTIPVSKNALVSILKDLPEKTLANIFWETFVAIDSSPLTASEKKAIAKAKAEFRKGETVKWQDIK